MSHPKATMLDRKSTRLNSSHLVISYAVFCLKKKNTSAECHVSYNHTPSLSFILSTAEICHVQDANVSRKGSYLCFCRSVLFFFFFFNDTATTEIYTLSLHDALPI